MWGSLRGTWRTKAMKRKIYPINQNGKAIWSIMAIKSEGRKHLEAWNFIYELEFYEKGNWMKWHLLERRIRVALLHPPSFSNVPGPFLLRCFPSFSLVSSACFNQVPHPTKGSTCSSSCHNHICLRHVVYRCMSNVLVMFVQDVLSMVTCWMSQSCLSSTCFLWLHVKCPSYACLRRVVHGRMSIPKPFNMLSS